MPLSLASKAQKYRELAANMADPADVRLISDFAESLEDLSRCECNFRGSSSNNDLDLDRQRLRYILSGAYTTPVVAPLMLEIMFTELLQNGKTGDS